MRIPVEKFLKKFREREPSAKKALTIWLARDKAKRAGSNVVRLVPVGMKPKRKLLRPNNGKTSLYFDNVLSEELEREAARLDRSFSWVIQQAWILARDKIRTFPGVQEGT